MLLKKNSVILNVEQELISWLKFFLETKYLKNILGGLKSNVGIFRRVIYLLFNLFLMLRFTRLLTSKLK